MSMQYNLISIRNTSYYGVVPNQQDQTTAISEDLTFAEHVIQMLNENQVELCHVRDIVHDLQYEKYVLA